MKLNSLYIVPRGSFMDKNNNLQFTGKPAIADQIRSFVIKINEYNKNSKFNKLNLFIQGDSKSFDGKGSWWIMIEAWSYNDDLFFEFAEFVAEKFNLNLEIGLPK